MLRRTTRALVAPVLVAGLALLGQAAPATGVEPAYEHLVPGGQPRLVERLPVNVVLVGYDAPAVDAEALRTALPAEYEPVVRSRLNYGVTERLGITYEYDHRVRYADRAYENRVFRELARLARPAPLTENQRAYNAQERNVLDVDANVEIDAPSVERWLALHPPKGVDTRRNTVFLLNWYGRADFRHHVYTKTGEPDPDTGYDFGAERDSRRMVAWGGTPRDDEETGLGSTRRVWFHDASAGPEQWSGSANVDDADLDDDGRPDYRIPPVWEYRRGGFRSPRALTGDLARLVRYVALDLLFTTSPLYPVELPPRELPETVDLDVNTYEGWKGVDASRRYLDRDLLLAELQEVMRDDRLSADSQDLPFTGDARRCYVEQIAERSCYPQLGYPPYGNLFLQNTFQLDRALDDQGRVDYELPIFNYAVRGLDVPALGYADDDYRDGDQSYVFAFLNPDVVESGYGLTTTLIHEVGHHVGLSHPHDGYDSRSGKTFGPTGDTYFVWAGDQSNSIMSYIDVNWDFSQFDRDNMLRFRTAARIEAANRLAGAALAAARPAAAADELRRADRLVGTAELLFARHDYGKALTVAAQAYDRAAEGAAEAGVDVDAAVAAARRPAAADRRAAPAHQPGEFIDTLDPDGPRSQP